MSAREDEIGRIRDGADKLIAKSRANYNAWFDSRTRRQTPEDKPMTDETTEAFIDRMNKSPMRMRGTDKGNVSEYLIADIGRLINLARTAATLQEQVRELEAKLQKEAKEGHELHEAYLRIRAIIPGAWKTPFAPTSEQVWKTTEDAAEALRAREAKLLKVFSHLLRYVRIPPELPDGLCTGCRTHDFPVAEHMIEYLGKTQRLILWMDGVTIGDFRRARAALEQDKPHG